MIAQAQAELPNECCGLLAGQVDTSVTGPPVGSVLARYALINGAHSPVRYLSEEKSLFAAHRDMRQRCIDVLAIYHSHPTSAPVPSKTDLQQNYWPGVVHVIVSLERPEPEVRFWRLEPDRFTEAEVEIVDGATR